eukprot:jgi/Bigna1/82516/fgenesh1_pg.93_\
MAPLSVRCDLVLAAMMILGITLAHHSEDPADRLARPTPPGQNPKSKRAATATALQVCRSAIVYLIPARSRESRSLIQECGDDADECRKLGDGPQLCQPARSLRSSLRSKILDLSSLLFVAKSSSAHLGSERPPTRPEAHRLSVRQREREDMYTGMTIAVWERGGELRGGTVPGGKNINSSAIIDPSLSIIEREKIHQICSLIDRVLAVSNLPPPQLLARNSTGFVQNTSLAQALGIKPMHKFDDGKNSSDRSAASKLDSWPPSSSSSAPFPLFNGSLGYAQFASFLVRTSEGTARGRCILGEMLHLLYQTVSGVGARQHFSWGWKHLSRSCAPVVPDDDPSSPLGENSGRAAAREMSLTTQRGQHICNLAETVLLRCMAQIRTESAGALLSPPSHGVHGRKAASEPQGGVPEHDDERAIASFEPHPVMDASNDVHEEEAISTSLDGGWEEEKYYVINDLRGEMTVGKENECRSLRNEGDLAIIVSVHKYTICDDDDDDDLSTRYTEIREKLLQHMATERGKNPNRGVRLSTLREAAPKGRFFIQFGVQKFVDFVKAVPEIQVAPNLKCWLRTESPNRTMPHWVENALTKRQYKYAYYRDFKHNKTGQAPYRPKFLRFALQRPHFSREIGFKGRMRVNEIRSSRLFSERVLNNTAYV